MVVHHRNVRPGVRQNRVATFTTGNPGVIDSIALDVVSPTDAFRLEGPTVARGKIGLCHKGLCRSRRDGTFYPQVNRECPGVEVLQAGIAATIDIAPSAIKLDVAQIGR